MGLGLRGLVFGALGFRALGFWGLGFRASECNEGASSSDSSGRSLLFIPTTTEISGLGLRASGSLVWPWV